jgi:hypothetical protein
VDSDRRKHRRFGLRKPASLRVSAVAESLRGHLTDMSEGGAYITVPPEAQDVDVGGAAYVRFVVDGHVCEATGQVVRVMPFGAERGVGVAFAVANDELIEFLRKLATASEFVRPTMLGDIDELFVQLA